MKVFMRAEDIRPPRKMPLLTAILWSDFDAVRVAVADGADLEKQDPEGATPLLFASEKNSSPEISGFLIEQGACLTAASAHNASVLHGFARAGWLSLTEKAIQAGCVVDQVDSYGNSPLSLACKNAHAEVVKLLLRCGADPSRDLWNGMTIVHEATEPVLDALIEAGISMDVASNSGLTALMYQAGQGAIARCAALIARGADVHAVDQEGTPALLYALKADKSDVFLLLLKAGAGQRFDERFDYNLADAVRGASSEIQASYAAFLAKSAMENAIKRAPGSNLQRP
jgi:ankyrin repeat protein